VIGNDAGWTQIARDQVEILKDDVGTVLAPADYERAAEGLGARGLRLAGLAHALVARVRSGPAGPSDEERRRSRGFVWGEVEDAAGRRARSRIATVDGYTYTARAALAIVERALAGQAPPGFQTPAKAYGPDIALAVEGTTRVDEPVA
jgi:short subunit dehydrogenase-like uncharacterized protein